MKPAREQHPVSTFGDAETTNTSIRSLVDEVSRDLLELEAWLTAAHAMLGYKTPHREVQDVQLAAQACARAQTYTREALRLTEAIGLSLPERLSRPKSLDLFERVAVDALDIVGKIETVRVSLTYIEATLEMTDCAQQCDTLVFSSRVLDAAFSAAEKLREPMRALIDLAQSNRGTAHAAQVATEALARAAGLSAHPSGAQVESVSSFGYGVSERMARVSALIDGAVSLIDDTDHALRDGPVCRAKQIIIEAKSLTDTLSAEAAQFAFERDSASPVAAQGERV